MKRVSFAATYPDELAHPMHRRIVESSEVSRVELLMWGPMSTVTTLTWFDAGPDAVADVLDSVETVTTTHLVAGNDGTYAFVHQTDYEFESSLLELVSQSKVVFLPPVTFHDTGIARFEAVGESDYMGEFYARLSDLLDATIESVHDFRRGPSAANVTDRQRNALEAAVAVGYYEVPRSGAVEDVAAELDCAASNAGELLRKAESAVVTAFVREG
ncbi:helix-turn-helix domain-containing protein [Halorussus salinisoli]|uniref:helix-turn-helix domain-containing protein n=1 Tax=Halorussus salinisoli TaxID=2558242 RepID=UPI0010C1FD5A|nr:helix-turn-helix domain-containing protein [Halorussus salinisoli]